jgi:hypothetical protein
MRSYCSSAPSTTGSAEPVLCNGLEDPKLPRLLPKEAVAKLREEVEMAKGLCPPFDQEAYREGHLKPVYFGTARNNFGVSELGARSPSWPRRRARSRPIRVRSPPRSEEADTPFSERLIPKFSCRRLGATRFELSVLDISTKGSRRDPQSSAASGRRHLKKVRVALAP